SPVGSRMAIMLGGAAHLAAKKLIAKCLAIAAIQLDCGADDLDYAGGAVTHRASGRTLSWMDLVTIAHRNYHLLPEGSEPGLEASQVYQVPNGGDLPTADGRIQMYPCHSFEFHVVLTAIDPITGKVDLKRYLIGHDCGV